MEDYSDFVKNSEGAKGKLWHNGTSWLFDLKEDHKPDRLEIVSANYVIIASGSDKTAIPLDMFAVRYI
jgi:hypothetical protein